MNIHTQQRALGRVAERSIRSTIGPFHHLPGYRVRYPAVVIEALGQLYAEYNAAFRELIAVNREWPEDYQYAFFGPGGSPVNFGVQVDMLGLTDEFLAASANMSVDQVRESLRGMVFEIENSMAMYQLLERICAPEGEDLSYFQPRWRAALGEIRQRFGKPIALLAVTEPKYAAMRESEFGKVGNEPLTDAEVMELSGFDTFFGPEQFRRHLAENNGQCGYLLYARTSDPVAVLKKPGLAVEHPLLGDAEMRRIIKANALTFNVDAPEMHHARRINDTKGYMAPMAMAFQISGLNDLLSPEVVGHLAAGRSFDDFEGPKLSVGFNAYLTARGVDVHKVVSGEIHLRAKPAKGTYGCYGHVRGPLNSGAKFRKDLAFGLRQRGLYVIQPEMNTPRIVNLDNEAEYTFIDRNFMAWTNGRPVFMGGFRSLMPTVATEATKGRIHGNGDTVWAEVVAD